MLFLFFFFFFNFFFEIHIQNNVDMEKTSSHKCAAPVSVAAARQLFAEAKSAEGYRMLGRLMKAGYPGAFIDAGVCTMVGLGRKIDVWEAISLWEKGVELIRARDDEKWRKDGSALADLGGMEVNLSGLL